MSPNYLMPATPLQIVFHYCTTASLVLLWSFKSLSLCSLHFLLYIYQCWYLIPIEHNDDSVVVPLCLITFDIIIPSHQLFYPDNWTPPSWLWQILDLIFHRNPHFINIINVFVPWSFHHFLSHFQNIMYYLRSYVSAVFKD